MTDLTDRLAALRPAVSDPGTDSDIDPAADLARGRRALRRRRLRLAAGGVTLTAAIVVTASVAATSGPATHRSSVAASGVRLVAYHGVQPPGFEVAAIPEGFVLSATTGGYLDIAPPDVHTPGADFVGKVVVSLQSVDVTTPPQGTPVTVNGHPGAISTDPDAKGLDYTDGTHRIYIQAWHSVGWSDEELVRFAEGVTVTADAQETHG